MRGNDLDSFRILEHIVRAGSFTKAAAKLFKTVPAISYNISQLEQNLGIKLLDRTGYRVKLTPAGDRMLREARAVIMQADHLQSLALQLSNDWEPKLELVFDGMLDPGIILDVISQVKSLGAPTIFQLTTEYLDGVEKRFEAGSADIMFSLSASSDERWIQEYLFEIEAVLVAAPSTGLDKDKQYLAPELSSFLEVSVQDSSYEQPEPGRSLGNLEHFFVGDFYIKKKAILNGMGIGWMPLGWIQKELESGELFRVDIEHTRKISYPVYVGQRKNQASGQAQTLFIDKLRHRFMQQADPAANDGSSPVSTKK